MGSQATSVCERSACTSEAPGHVATQAWCGYLTFPVRMMAATLLLEADPVLAAELKRLEVSAPAPFDTERDFWRATELKLCVTRLHMTALQSLQSAT
eukprot:6736207-Prymnesium_polylepis.1